MNYMKVRRIKKLFDISMFVINAVNYQLIIELVLPSRSLLRNDLRVAGVECK